MPVRPIASPPSLRRLIALRQLLARHAVDGLLVTRQENIRYLVGFTGTMAQLLVSPDMAWLIVDVRYVQQAQQELGALGGHVQIVQVMGTAYGDAVHEAIRLAGIDGKRRRLGFEGHDLPFHAYRDWLIPLTCRPIPLIEVVEELRMRKDGAELAIIRAAAGITGKAMQKIHSMALPGITEHELAAALSYQAKLLGGDGDAFDPLVASGPRTALLHARPTRTAVQVGDLLLIDWGARLGGYMADVSRTWVIGRPDPQQKKWLCAVQEALEAAIAASQVGVLAKDIHACAWQVLDRHGLSAYFPHNLGHGLGLEIHEEPGIGPQGETRLEAGMAIALEPGLYLPGWGGVRLEQTVLVTDAGPEVLTDFPL